MTDTTSTVAREPAVDDAAAQDNEPSPIAVGPGTAPEAPTERATPEPAPTAANVPTNRPHDASERIPRDRVAPTRPAEPGMDRRPGDGGRAPLFDDQASGDLRTRWTDVQAMFVDEPRAAVEQADALVGDVMERLADTFTRERHALEGQWSRGEDVTTEDLRLALQRYRSFFDRLLAL